MKKVFITGTAGFIGYHLAKLLLEEGYTVKGYDGMTAYYDVSLKRCRHDILKQNPAFSFTEGLLEDGDLIQKVAGEFKPDIIVHLAAQAGVRYSIENPRAYIDANILGSFHVLEIARLHNVEHLLMASTSSVYGANEKMPFAETDTADTQLTLYAATKKANEAMAHSYSNLWGIPTTMLRFFTVYGPMGRPDLALFKFVDAILDGREIDIYNKGEMYRDFTYVDDLANAIRLLFSAPPQKLRCDGEIDDWDSLSPVAPFRVVNIGNSKKIKLLDFIEVIEKQLGISAKRNLMPMQMGDVPATLADTRLLEELTGYSPQTDIEEGVGKFVEWYRDYYQR